MLTLYRNPLETIVLEGNLIIKILGVQGNRVRLGIHAPQDPFVQHKEIQLCLEEEITVTCFSNLLKRQR